jgi:hypothetical protein
MVLVGACATGETPMLSESMDPSELGGSAGAGPSGAGTFGDSGSGGGNTAGSFASGGETTGGTFSTGGFPIAGTGFGMSGSATGGTPAGGGGAGGAGEAGGAGGNAGAGGTGKAGSGGSGGTPPNGNCAQDPLGPKGDWEATASIEADDCVAPTSDYCGPPERAIDGVANNRYTTGRARMGDEWFQLDFSDTAAVSRVVLTTAAGSSDYTRDYEVRMGDNEGTIDASTPVATGMGQQGVTTINFATKTGRFLRIYQKTAVAGWWSLAEVHVSCQ